MENMSKYLTNKCQVWEICIETDCHAVNVIYFPKCSMCSENVTYIGKRTGDNTKGLKVRLNQYISDSKTGVSTCKFPCHVCDCGIFLSSTFFPLERILTFKILIFLKKGF